MGYTPAQLYVKKVGTTTSVYGLGNATGEILQILPNLVDTYPKLTFEGGGSLKLQPVGGGGAVYFYDGPDVIASTYLTGLDWTFTTGALSNYNIFLNPNGTGKLKFGTHTGSGDVACNGSIAILDSGGNARKLMTTA